jgi:hypothetical protein
MLFEEKEGSTMEICDAYGYPYRLLSQEKSASYNDVREFKKALYQDTIIPEANSFYEQLNDFFALESLNLVLKKDYSGESIMQEDIKLMAESRLSLARSAQMDFLTNAITLNQYREIVSHAGPEIPSTTDGNVKYSDIKDLIGKATIKAGEISQVDPGDEANAESIQKLQKDVIELKKVSGSQSTINSKEKELEYKINNISKEILYIKNKLTDENDRRY